MPEEQAREQLKKGLKAISIFDYGEALYQLRAVPDSLPEGSKEWEKATFGLASALRYTQPTTEENTREAIELFELLAAKAKSPVIRSLSQMELGRIWEISDFAGDSVDLEKAREYYRAVIDERAEPGIANEAVIRLGNSLIKEFKDPAQVQEGINVVTDYLEKYPDNAQAAVMWQLIAVAEDMVRNDQKAALEAYEKAYGLGFAVPSKADNFLWIMVRLAKETGNEEKAVKYAQATLSDTPRSAHGTLARRLLEEMQQKHPDWNIEIPERASYQDFAISEEEEEKPADGGETKETTP